MLELKKRGTALIQSNPSFLLLDRIYSYGIAFIHIEEGINRYIVETKSVKAIFVSLWLALFVYPVIITKILGLVKFSRLQIADVTGCQNAILLTHVSGSSFLLTDIKNSQGSLTFSPSAEYPVKASPPTL